MAKILSKFRKKKINALKKINKNKKAQLIKQEDLLTDVLAPIINKNVTGVKSRPSKISTAKIDTKLSSKKDDKKKEKEKSSKIHLI